MTNLPKVKYYGSKSNRIDYAELPRVRRIAAKLGFKHYMPVEKCKSGHSSPRETSSSFCLACMYARSMEEQTGIPWKEVPAKLAEAGAFRRLIKEELNGQHNRAQD